MWKIILVLLATAAVILGLRLAYDGEALGARQVQKPVPMAYLGIRG